MQGALFGMVSIAEGLGSPAFALVFMFFSKRKSGMPYFPGMILASKKDDGALPWECQNVTALSSLTQQDTNKLVCIEHIADVELQSFPSYCLGAGLCNRITDPGG